MANKRTKTLPSPPKTSHTHFVETYVSGEKITAVLRKHSESIRRYAFIYHDQDKNDDGSLKIPHWHILLDLTNNWKPENIRDWFYDFDEFGRKINTLDQIAQSKRLCWEYLTHENHPEKFQYSTQGIFTNDRAYFENLCSKKDADSSLVEAVDELLEGASTSWLLNKYGRDFIMNYNKIKMVADQIRFEEQRQTLAELLSASVYSLEIRYNSLQTEITELEQKLSALRVQISNEVMT